MEITRIRQNKERYLPLLLLADEQEDMIFRYLERGAMYVLTQADTKALCVVTDEGDGILEIKNLAVAPSSRRQGWGRMLIRFLEEQYRGRYRLLQVGTGDSPMTIPFYEACGFARHHVVPNFFTDNYDHPILEDGVLLRDMIYLQKEI